MDGDGSDNRTPRKADSPANAAVPPSEFNSSQLSSTPTLLFATQDSSRTPIAGAPPSPFHGQRMGTPIGVLPRGDLGRSSRVAHSAGHHPSPIGGGAGGGYGMGSSSSQSQSQTQSFSATPLRSPAGFSGGGSAHLHQHHNNSIHASGGSTRSEGSVGSAAGHRYAPYGAQLSASGGSSVPPSARRQYPPASTSRSSGGAGGYEHRGDGGSGRRGRGGGAGGGAGGGGGGGDGGGDPYDDGYEDADDADLAALTGMTHDDQQGDMTDLVIWGTTIVAENVRNVFSHFIETFRPSAANGLDVDERDAELDSPLSFYQRAMEVMHRTGDMILNVNGAHLHAYAPTRTLYFDLKRFPQEVIPIMDRVVMEEYCAMYGEPEGGRRIQVRTFGLKEQSRMRGLDPDDIDQLLCIQGMVIRTSNIIPDLKQAFFRCSVCAHSIDVMVSNGQIDEPTSCQQCQKAGSMEIVHNRCLFTDKQLIKLQESSEEIPEGETPYTVTLFAFDDLVDSVRPGDRIEVTGIYRAIPRRVNPKMRTVKSIFKTHIDVIHFRRCNLEGDSMTANGGAALGAASGGTAHGGTAATPGAIDEARRSIANLTGNPVDPSANNASAQFSPQRLREFRQFVAHGDTYDRLVRSFAPSVFEMEDVKRGLLCMLFGGTQQHQQKVKGKRRRGGDGGNSGEGSSRRRTDGGGNIDDDGSGAMRQDLDREAGGDRAAGIEGDERNRQEEEEEEEEEDDEVNTVHQRGDINILLCGDPGTSKSQLLGYVHKLTPRGIYTSGKGSSAVGLTASVVRDPETNDMVLESGALVLSDNGICCIDEFDKMNDQTRAILHEAMEQQTVSITKAGIIASLNARTSILASANPVESRYNARLSVVENIKLTPTLLSRFDLIYLILDKPNAETDRRLAKHLVSLFNPDDGAGAAAVALPNAAGFDPSAPTVDQGFLRDFILYARTATAPQISDEAETVLVTSYLELRAVGGGGRGGNSKTITATPRQLESLIRLSQALAKMRLSSIVTAGDVFEATRLVRVATQTAATDPRTGTIDMDMITTGRSAIDRELVGKLVDELRRMFSSMKGSRVTVGQIRQTLLKNMNGSGGTSNTPSRASSLRAELGEISVSMAEVEEAVRELESENVLQFVERTQTAIIRG